MSPKAFCPLKISRNKSWTLESFTISWFWRICLYSKRNFRQFENSSEKTFTDPHPGILLFSKIKNILIIFKDSSDILELILLEKATAILGRKNPSNAQIINVENAILLNFLSKHLVPTISKKMVENGC